MTKSMANRNMILTPYQVFILPCIILIFWSLFLIVFKSDGSGTWKRDIDWLILNQGKQIPRFWFVFNETEEVCSCVTGFEKCNFKKLKKEKDYLCTCPTHFSHGLRTYCTKSNYQKDILEYEDEIMDLFVIRRTNNCQHYGGYSSLEYQNFQLPCPFCFDEITQCSLCEHCSVQSC
ncbi:unnamed protein product [Schistosoma rodhaini]|uniref:Uncharacterized protein n=1 Tax=Schistosoma rodhaini TaxID=6188 RepID=A0AA85FPW1_9TREM|nr:unnamed protein product [Schistosoma rodhaini]